MISTLDDLTQHAGDYFLSLAPCATGIDPADHAKQCREASDYFCKRAVRYLHRRRPRDEAGRQRMLNKFVPRVQQDMVCGFVFISTIAGAFLSWALQKLFDWLWGKWWTHSHDAETNVAAMAASVTGIYDGVDE
jgi:hypothetical protein